MLISLSRKAKEEARFLGLDTRILEGSIKEIENDLRKENSAIVIDEDIGLAYVTEYDKEFGTVDILNIIPKRNVMKKKDQKILNVKF